MSVAVIDISRGESFNNWLVNSWVAIRTVGKLLWLAPRADLVSFHASMRGRILFGPVVYAVSILLRKPAIMRAFGGGFAEQYESLGTLRKWVLRRTYFNAAACLFETKRLVNFFRAIPIRRAEWFS
ncbi:MAG: hypothetical protein HY509_01745, partial [Acidobacteria bacterium]|nr:hypothetical protein [Acidobacteriota bacterium]